MANATRHLTTGLRCRIYGATGVIVQVDGEDITVRLDGEGQRTDIWQACQVESVSA